jgi:protein TIF31
MSFLRLNFYSFFSENNNIDEIFNKYKLRKLLLLRQFCQKNGVQLNLREYNFENKHKEVFHEDDILNLFPIVKHVPPKVCIYFIKT